MCRYTGHPRYRIAHMNFRKTMLLSAVVMTAALALLEVLSKCLDMPTVFRWANMMQLAWLSLAALGAMEAWPSTRVRADSAYIGAALLVGVGIVGLERMTTWLPVTSPEQAVLSVLVGFWVATFAQALKASLLIRSVVAACFLSPLPFVNTFALLAWGVPQPGLAYVFPTAIGVGCFIGFYASVQAGGHPKTLLQWLRLNETRRTAVLP